MSAPDSENRSSRFAVVALILALAGGAAMLYYHLELFIPRSLAVQASRDLGNGYAFGNDFYQIWLTCRASLRSPRDPYSRDLYSEQMTREIQIGLYGRPLDPRIPTDPVDRRGFPYPAFTDLLLWPSAELPFPVARIVMLVLLVSLTLVSLLLWLRVMAWRLSPIWLAVIVVLAFSSYPVLEALYADQLGLLVGFLLAWAILALRQGRLLLSGVLLALTTVKPQMTLLIILYLVLWTLYDWHSRKRFCIGFLSITALLLGGSLVVWPGWIESWTHTLIAYHGYTRPPLIREVLAAPLGQRAAGPVTLVLFAALMLLAAGLAWRYRAAAPSSREFWLTLSLLLAISSVTLLPGQAVYDHVILLPGIFLLLRDWRQLRNAGRIARGLLAIGTIVLFWPWFAAIALVLARPLVSSEVFHSTSVFSLPIRTAASLPFAVLALLGCAMRAGVIANRESA